MLSPETAASAVEAAYGLDLDGSVQVYPSYVNRVYGLRDSEGGGWVVKFLPTWPLDPGGNPRGA